MWGFFHLVNPELMVLAVSLDLDGLLLFEAELQKQRQQQQYRQFIWLKEAIIIRQ